MAVKHTKLDTDTCVLNSDTLCGPYKPAFLQRLARPLVFTAHSGILLAIFYCGINYFAGIITTIEKQFQLSSSEVAALSVVDNAVSLGLAIFLSYYGHKSHRPRWIATGCILVSISFLFFALPHFLSEPIDTQSLLSGGTSTAQESGAISTTGTCMDGSNMAPYQQNQTFTNDDNYSKNVSNQCAEESQKNGLGSVKWFLIGQVINGCGSSALFILIMSYLNDSVKGHKFTSYTAFLLITTMLGPMTGFFLTSEATTLYVDFDRIPTDQIPNIQQNDPRWIGAWWLFFPLFSILLFIAALPMYFYLKVMTSDPVESCGVDEDGGVDGADADAGDATSIQMAAGRIFKDTSGGIIQSFKGIFLAIRRLLTNASFVLLCFGSTAETAFAVISGTFQVKYFQTQFGTSPSAASQLMGGILIPAICVGQIVSAIICSRFKFSTRQCVGLMVCCQGFALIFGILQLFIGCTDFPVAGVNFPYTNIDATATDLPNGTPVTQIYEPILQDESTCNSGCSCPDEILQPVCGADGISYISPCHAGCTEMSTTNISSVTEYSNCVCVSSNLHGNFDEEFNATTMSGLCRGSCNTAKKLTLLLAVEVVTKCVMSLTFAPFMFVIFRLVDAEDKSIALGFQSVISKCLGYFPGPILMGMVINSTCILWQYTCGNRGSCWLYDILAYRYLFIGILAALKLISVICHAGENQKRALRALKCRK